MTQLLRLYSVADGVWNICDMILTGGKLKYLEENLSATLYF
jgi:hypothetical protein